MDGSIWTLLQVEDMKLEDGNWQQVRFLFPQWLG